MASSGYFDLSSVYSNKGTGSRFTGRVYWSVGAQSGRQSRIDLTLQCG